MLNVRENDERDWIQVKHKNSPKTKSTSPVNSVTKHNACGILSHSDNPIPDKRQYILTPHLHNRMGIFMNTIGNARLHGSSISNECYVY
jgi:hypothetical protein